MAATRECRTTSLPVKSQNAISSMSSRMARTPLRPETPRGRSSWVTSPVTTIFEPKPRRVRNIFICSGVVFCASSRMMKLSFRVRPRMNASGAISMTPLSTSCVARSMSVMSNSAS